MVASSFFAAGMVKQTGFVYGVCDMEHWLPRPADFLNAEVDCDRENL